MPLGTDLDLIWPKKLNKKQRQQKIPFMWTSKRQRVDNPKDIANRFSCYYASLCNLKDSPSDPDPDPVQISQFLDSLQLPSLTSDQLETA